MSWLCKVFGHKYVCRIVTRIGLLTGSYSVGLDVHRCKRCGKRIDKK